MDFDAMLDDLYDAGTKRQEEARVALNAIKEDAERRQEMIDWLQGQLRKPQNEWWYRAYQGQLIGLLKAELRDRNLRNYCGIKRVSLSEPIKPGDLTEAADRLFGRTQHPLKQAL